MSLLGFLRRLRLMKPNREPEAPTLLYLKEQRRESVRAQARLPTGNILGDPLGNRGGRNQ